MEFSLEYILEGAGWACFHIQDGLKSFYATASYLHDSLRELAEAARALVQGAQNVRVVFMDEPGEVQLCLCHSGDVISYEARRFDDWNSWGMHPDDAYEVVAAGVTTASIFVAEVHKALRVLYETYGVETYKEKWIEHDFPVGLLEELTYLTEAEPRRESGTN